MPFIIPANTLATGGYDVDNSLRFNDGSSDNLSREPSSSSAAGRRKFTISAWVKRGNLTAEMGIFSGGADSNASGFYTLMFDDADKLRVQYFEDAFYNIMPNMLFRDTSAWYHIVVSNDTTNSTSANRTKIYVNGVQRAVVSASGGTAEQPNSNFDYNVNDDSLQQVGARRNSGGSPAGYFDGYIAEFCMIDNQVLAADSFGEFDDSGIWKPIKVSGLTFGTNGFYLEFKGAGTSANASGMGADTSGNTHHFTVGNLTAVDQSTDTCTNNFATMNPLDNFYAGGTFAEGNLQVTTRNTGYSYNTSTFGLATGKWYWEVKWSAQNTGSTNQVQIGIAKRVSASSTTWLGSVAYTYGYQGASGHVQNNDGNASGSVATTYSVGDIISVAMDLDNNKIHFAKNGTYTNSSNPATNSGGVTITAPDSTSEDSGFYFPAFGDGNNNLVETGQFNFGSPPYAISSGNQDADGFGNFEYAVPSGYFALNTKNLAEYG